MAGMDQSAEHTHLFLLGAPSRFNSIKLQMNLYIAYIPIQCARARPDFWGAFRSAANFLVCAIAMLCTDWSMAEAIDLIKSFHRK